MGLEKSVPTEQLTNATWRRSQFTTPDADNVVEVAFIGQGDDMLVAVRDSKNPEGPVLVFNSDEWDAFVGGAKDGEFDED